MATIKDIAAKSGVSIATVSKHINGIPVKEANRLRIDAAIAELGYQVNSAARTLKTRRSMTIGILLDRLSNLFYTAVISEAEEVLREAGYTTILCETKEDEATALARAGLLRSKSVDGILLLSSRCSKALIRQCREWGIPLVVADSIDPFAEGCDFVLTENALGAFGAVETLIRCGHRKIAVITGEEGHFSAGERLRGYKNALLQAGLPCGPFIFRDSYDFDGGYRCMKRLLAGKDRPTALLICNYFMALGAVMALNEENVPVPGALSVITFDEIELIRAMKPRLTAVKQQTALIAKKAAECLLSRIEGDDSPPRVCQIPTVLVPGESVSPLEESVHR